MADSEFPRAVEQLFKRLEALELIKPGTCLVSCDGMLSNGDDEALRLHRMMHRSFDSARYVISYSPTDSSLPGVTPFETESDLISAELDLIRQINASDSPSLKGHAVYLRTAEGVTVLIGAETSAYAEKTAVSVHRSAVSAHQLKAAYRGIIDYVGERSAKITEEIRRMRSGSLYIKSRDSRQSETDK